MSTVTGIDVPIASLRDAFASLLWPDVSNKIYYSRVFHNLDKNGNLIGEVFTEGKDYKEVMFDDRYMVNSFFDVSDTIENVNEELQTTRDVGIIFQCHLPSVYPTATNRLTEELYRDVLRVINTHSMLVTPNSIEAGLGAYGDMYTGNLREFDMQPWHVFRVNTTMRIDYTCGVERFPTAGIQVFEYPFPIILTN